MKGDAERIVQAIRDERVMQIYFDVDVDGNMWPVSIDLLRKENIVMIHDRAGCDFIGTLCITESQGGRIHIAVEGRTGTYGVIFKEDDVMNLYIRRVDDDAEDDSP